MLTLVYLIPVELAGWTVVCVRNITNRAAPFSSDSGEVGLCRVSAIDPRRCVAGVIPATGSPPSYICRKKCTAGTATIAVLCAGRTRQTNTVDDFCHATAHMERVFIRRFGGLSYRQSVKLGTPSDIRRTEARVRHATGTGPCCASALPINAGGAKGIVTSDPAARQVAYGGVAAVPGC